MKINILQYMPMNTKIEMGKELVGALFKEKKLSEWGEIFGIHLKNLSRYRNGSRAIPLEIFLIILEMKKISLKFFQNKISLKINNTGKFIKIGPYIDINEDWIYISELIKGDGHITPNFWSITFVNNNSILIDYVRNFFISLGLNKSQISLYKRDDAQFLIVRSSLLSYIFNKILEVPVGKKEEINIGSFVIKNKKFGIAAIRGAFDAEGTVTMQGSRRISISSQSLTWINNLNAILNRLKIKSKIQKDSKGREKPIYRIFIYHIINLKRFNNIIKPLHSERKNKLQRIINNFDKNPSRLNHKKILESIQRGNLRRQDIAKDIKKDPVLVNNMISYLKNKGYIVPFEKIYTNNGCFFKYEITGEGLGKWFD